MGSVLDCCRSEQDNNGFALRVNQLENKTSKNGAGNQSRKSNNASARQT